jgi:HPr kinase/phosphorylase
LGEQESSTIPTMAVSELLTELGADPLAFELVAGEDGLTNLVTYTRIQKPGLALAGFLEYIHSGRIQILGKSEMTFLGERPPAERGRIMAQLCRQGASCFVVTHGTEPTEELLEVADKQAVPVLVTQEPTPRAIDVITRFLEDRLAPRVVVQGVLLDIYGLGVLLIGDSGVGKSECALDLVARGHRLVSDDVVEIKRRNETLVGTGPELTRYHMELRGVGIVNVKDLFGVAAVRLTKFVEYVVKLDPLNAEKRYDRLGLDEQGYPILGVDLPYIEMPVGPGRNLAVLVEVAARNHLLKLKGYHPAKRLAQQLNRQLRSDWSESEFDDPLLAEESQRKREDRES